MAVEGLVEAGQETRHTPCGEPASLSLAERGVWHRRGVLERGQHRRSQLVHRDVQSRAQCQADAVRGLWTGLRSGCGPQASHRGADANRPDAVGEPLDLTRREPMQGRQVRPLVRERLERAQVEKQRRAVLAGTAVQRRSDEVADPGCGQDVLRGEEPVVGSKIGAPTQRDRLPQQPHAERPCPTRGNRPGEEHPHVRADAGPGDLERRGHPERPRRLDVGERVEHRRSAVEVSREPVTGVACQQRVEPQVHLAEEVGLHDAIGQPQVGAKGALSPAALDRRGPARLSRSGVLPAGGVHISARGEQRAEEPHLVPASRRGCDRTRVVEKQPGLGWARRSRLLGCQLQQPVQPRVLRTQPDQLRLERFGLGHGHHPITGQAETR